MIRGRGFLAGMLVFAVVGCSGSQMAASSDTAGALLGAWEAPATYQNEARAKVRMNGDTVAGLAYTYHFNQIPDQKPYNLQNFFFSKNSVTGTVGDLEEVEDSWSVDGVCLIPNTKLQVVAEVGGAINKAGNRPWWGSIPDEMAYKFGLWYALQRELKVRLDFHNEGSMSQLDFGGIYVYEFGDQAVSPFLEGVLDTSTSDNNIGVNLGIDYYPMKALSIGVVLADLTEDLNPFLGMVTVINAKYYTGPMAISLGYTLLDPVDDVIEVGLEYRF